MPLITLVEGDEQLIGPIVKHEWNVAMHELHNVLVHYKHNSLLLTSLPYTK